ncbi:hypothetical protein HX021_15255 [Sphingobacterium sp. N143]|uniref:hypothetical protein n=1 Tax=Sphingobacterium sp. N143 TaxID=2746727 RepID=UPI002575D8B3|nr:hypothetical protein [Sphingobacterium sp. N143]MDM1295648.1 hypothetical protein [Sphingobacterium sp. N143]
MKNYKGIINSILFIFVTITCSAQVYDRELDNHKEKTKNEFFKLISKIANQLSDSTLTTQQQYILFDPMIEYAQAERSSLMQLRKKYLQNIAPPPKELIYIPFTSLENSDLTNILQDPKFSTITLLQCYKPIEIASVITGLLQPHIYQKEAIGADEASINYTFGNQIFAKEFGEDIWQIWAINQLYGFRFNLDLKNMLISKPEYIPPHTSQHLNLQLTFKRQKQEYEIDQLYQEMNEIRWNAYNTDLLKESTPSTWQDTVERKIKAFYLKHQSRFSKVRNTIVKDLEKGMALDSNWEEIVDLFSNEERRLYQALKTNILHPNEAAYQLFSICNGISPFNQNIEEIGKNAMVGFINRNLGKEKDDRWKIQSKGYSIAFEYSWNIKEGSFSTLKVFKRKR